MMYSVICTVALIMSNGSREVLQLRGLDIDSKSSEEHLYVDFSKEWPKHAVSPPVMYVLSNSCSYLDVINGTPVKINK